MNATRSIITVCALLTFFSCSAKEKNYQYSNNFAQEIGRAAVDPFMPVSFSPEGMNRFFKFVYNRPDYGTEFLPNNFTHMLQFLQYGLETQRGAAYAQSVLKLFSNKLKSSNYVNAYVFGDMIAPLQGLLKHYFAAPKARTAAQLKLSVNDVLYSSFLSQFDFFKQNPKAFFDGISHEILTSLNHELSGAERAVKQEQLRQTVIRFLELCASKLVWSPEQPSDVWTSIKVISDLVAQLMQDGIVQELDDIDDLLWSITHRFCFFLDLTGAELPLAFYQNVRQDLLRRVPLVCKLEEQEKLITKKSDILMQAVMTGEARARAYQTGIVTS